jgi:ABC-type bacteriocin/lantibiotic exporter with double-glycine peptidase domain
MILKSLKTSKIDHDLTPIEFKNSVVLKDVDYTFFNSSKPVLKKININIPKNSSVGFIGPSGSGKTTTVDVILGLLEAQNGSLEVDGQIIKRNNIRSWQTNIGYVPQHIYLSDDTIEANIAFGLEQEDIDKQAVIDACQKANLHDFIIDNLPKQYQTKVGENGARLSGGQRQRIGIARALFQKPKIIIFDEATSALDNDTEKVVMDAVNNLSNEKTIILISHRLNTLKNCDLIFKFNNGSIISKGTYDQLILQK